MLKTNKKYIYKKFFLINIFNIYDKKCINSKIKKKIDDYNYIIICYQI